MLVVWMQAMICKITRREVVGKIIKWSDDWML
jgi:hypothetical protein